MSANLRQRVERSIVDRTVDVLLAAGYQLSVHDGEQVTVERSSDAEKIKAALMTTDEDNLLAYEKDAEGDHYSWVRFVYGNDGWDVISDYGMSLEEVLKPVNEYAEKEQLELRVLDAEKPEGTLFDSVSEEQYRVVYRMMLNLRAEHPNYSDDELLAYLLVKAAVL